ncbi:hypothetical protein [Cupriavidus pauculus]|jgi:hypothetical protein|uniref:hypothetical protein n=1 Tax=Cupriavidus pauculus TaxID=82633 RepID=UPI0030F8C1BF
MIISPPFLPESGLTSNDAAAIDPMMDAVDKLELEHHGVYPIAFDRRWHCGTHLAPLDQTDAVRAIADGEVVAYRVSQTAISDGVKKKDGSPELNCNNGFVLLKHKTDTGEGRTITFYSLYMHLLDMNAQQRIAPQPIQPPATGSASALPAWLLHPTDGVKLGHDKLKVYRKDMLGLWGNCHGQPHLHFEIFMTEEDFNAYFDHTQLGSDAPTTPASTDYWGHSYYVIPGGQAFLSAPPGYAGSSYFPVLKDGTLDAQSKLYVEAYFHKGQRYTRSWMETAGKLTLLTPRPVADSCRDYEYNLFQRATDLYPSCPSAGYELLRFGRVLSIELPPLAATENHAWVAVTFNDSGAQGYIDISQSAIKKLSDADFPFFTGWQKIDELNTPFSQDGVCDYDELRKIVDVVEASETPAQREDPAYIQEDQLTAYVYGNDAVREKLRGFVCHAPSEWDKRGNEARYARLNQPDGFFGKRKDIDPDGYADFIKFVERLQFLDQVPSLGGGKKFWFFHPLAFIRHFRRCGWLSQPELVQLLPAYILDKDGASWKWVEVRLSWAAPFLSQSNSIASSRRIELNKALRKYGIAAPTRMACFFGNAAQESQWFQKFHERSSYWYKPWDGRGFLQISHASNYIKYWKYRGFTVPVSIEKKLTEHTKQANANRLLVNGKKAMYDPTNSLSDASTDLPIELIIRRDSTENAFEAADSAGAYWAWSKASMSADEYYLTPESTIKSLATANAGKKHYYENRAFGNVAGTVNTGSPSSSYSAIWGIQARFLAFGNAQVMLLDGGSYTQADGTEANIPQDYVRR